MTSCKDTLRTFSPGNDFARTVLLEYLDETTGTLKPVTMGTNEGFFAATDDGNAEAIDATVQVTGVDVSGNPIREGEDPVHPDGTWLFLVQGEDMEQDLLDENFAETGIGYFIVTSSFGIRKVEAVRYEPASYAEIEQ